ncbi:MAG: hypothetical protein K2G19_04445 [Lachnospiraceae bacterium]|nr:hypothetical protein [Lachnospiraceae bacterium]
MMQGNRLKSTQEKEQRQQKTAGQIEFWEQQKANLKNIESDTLEEIARKLEMFHNYDDEIAAAKAAYNNEQMFHILDEAREQGEKIAEAVEKTEPKTPEERKEELVEEALGTDEEKGVLSEVMDEMLEEVTEIVEEIGENAETLTQEMQEEFTGKMAENAEEMAALTERGQALSEQELAGIKAEMIYKRFDIRI